MSKPENLAVRLGSGLALLCLAFFPNPATAQEEKEIVPEGVQILLPRGKIPAIFDPQFVPANAAKMADDAWILGVFVEGQAKAYSLNLLNHHEVVNDRVGGTAFAAVW